MRVSDSINMNYKNRNTKQTAKIELHTKHQVFNADCVI